MYVILRAMMTKFNKNLLPSKYRGCMVGSVLGDCLGSPYEFDPVSNSVIQKYFDKLTGPYFKAPVLKYTDDTAMTRCVASSFIDKGQFDASDMAKKFVKEYFSQPKRGYGANIVDVFAKLKAEKVKDPFGPAKEQFDGTGSFGNGGAMRIAPVVLFCCNSYETMLDVAKKTTEITHTHRNGRNGALLQCIAIHRCLSLDPESPLDVEEFSSYLMQKLAEIEKPDDDLDLDDPQPYRTQLKVMHRFLKEKEPPSQGIVEEALGNDVSALRSVPTAIYSFLCSQKNIPHVKTDNHFQKAIQYAISLGGDTDTIASMTGALAGAFYGYDVINTSLQKHCEGVEDAITMADRLYDVALS